MPFQPDSLWKKQKKRFVPGQMYSPNGHTLPRARTPSG